MNPRPILLTSLIVLAGVSRLLPHPPNFAPITAMAVFGAIRFANRGTSIFMPLVALFLSDVIREVLYQYGLVEEWGLYRDMWTIYGTVAVITLMSRWARGTQSPSVIATTTLAGSCLFFLLTNFAFWTTGLFYPVTEAGLMECYTAALPFFRNSLMGDAFYATALFGLWAFAESRYPSLRSTPSTANS